MVTNGLVYSPLRRSIGSAENPFYSFYPFNHNGNIYPNATLRQLGQKSFQSGKRVPLAKLRKFARTTAAQRAFSKITNSVLEMELDVKPPSELVEDTDATEMALSIKRCLRSPNEEDEQNTFRKAINCIVEELLTVNRVMIERAWGGHKGEERFWFWATPASNFTIDPDWTPQQSGIKAKYYGLDVNGEISPFMASEVFPIILNPSVGDFYPPSPLETAFVFIETFLKLSDFQKSATGRGIKSYIINLKGAGDDEVEQFKNFWINDIEGEGEPPIIGGEGASIERTGAKGDEELYLKYTDFILRMIALSFNLNPQDFNIPGGTNRATAEVLSDESFSDAITPMGTCINDGINRGIVTYYHPDYTSTLQPSQKRREKEESEVADTLFNGNIMTRNEARQKVGLERIADGDRFLDGTPLIPDEDMGDDSLTAALDVDGEVPIEAAAASKTVRVPKKITETLRTKLTTHNGINQLPEQRATLTALKKVWRRGVTAYFRYDKVSASTAEEWGLTRVEEFIFLLRNGKPRVERYAADNDLLPIYHYRASRNNKSDHSR